MSLILLADDSPHAQRMGEHILREEGFEVALATDGNGALRCLSTSDPDLILADAFLPGRNGFALCRLVKRYRPYVRVVLTAGLLEDLDEEEARQAGCDAVLRKPFEASQAAALIRPLIEQVRRERGSMAASGIPVAAVPVSDAPAASPAAKPDPDRVRAAVEEALRAALPGLVRDITEKVLIALGH
jgi:CheY-like chemotaxis protein